MLTDQAVESLGAHVTREARILEASIEATQSDVLMLAATHAARSLPSATKAGNRKALRWELQRVFEALMLQKPAYTQIRLIGKADGGRELVRVNQMEGEIDSVIESSLQRKGGRYYFQETMAMPPGSIFVSKVDLNRERGIIVTPHQPVLRIATPVIDDTNAIAAMVIINIDLNILLRDVTPLREGGFVVLTNTDGDYLYHPNRSKTFAFEFGRTDRLPLEYGVEDRWRTWLGALEEPKPVHFATPGWMLALETVSIDAASAETRRHALVLGAVVSQARIQSQGNEVRAHLYLTLILVCGGLAVALGAATSFLTRPIRSLTEAANRIADGEQDVTVAVETQDEIGVLAADLNKMLDALKEFAETKELAALGRMAAMVAHDLRNALSSVKVNLQILERNRRDAGGAQDQQFEIALGQVRYMEDILHTLLSFARPETLRPDWCEMADIVRTATTSLLPQAAEKNVAFEIEDLAPLPRLWGDRAQLIRVFQNLTVNALEAVPNGGRVHITGKLVAGERGPEIMVEVTDDGRGIPEDIRDRLFEPFFTTRTKGTGLGLAIVKRIVEDHGGVVGFHSRVGTGTTMTLSLPLQGTGDGEGEDEAA